MRIGTTLAMLVAIVFCTACQYSPDMLDRTVAYNRAVADSTNQVLLLNIVRASERLPTYYTRLEGDAASMGITPSGGLSLPLSSPRSFEQDFNTGPTGAVTGGANKAVGSLANIVSTLGLSASESNIMTLQTLDDQKYQNGMMTPVPVKNIGAFQDEGYQRDLLFMMFLANVQVSGNLITPIDNAVAERCGQLKPQPGDSSGGSFIHQICAYIASKPYQAMFDPAAAQPEAYSFSLKTCADTGGAIREAPPKNIVDFINDPAREGRKFSSRDPHPQVCFQILLYDLLVLDLEVGSPQDVPSELVDVVPDAVAQNPQFRAQMIQQNFFFRETSAGVSAVCKRKNADTGFTLSFTNPQQRGATATPLNSLLTTLGVSDAKSAPPPSTPAPAPAKNPSSAKIDIAAAATAAYPSDPVAACQQKNPGVPESSKDALLASPADDTGAKSSAPQPVKLAADKIAFSTRSFEGMIYYLGEAVRYEENPDADAANFPRILGRNPTVAGSGYYEVMFYGSSHVPDSDAAVSVHDDSGTSFALPKSCVSMPLSQASRPVPCSAEYPDNESLQVLNFVNQVWGLQKESVAGPTSPLVVVTPQ